MECGIKSFFCCGLSDSVREGLDLWHALWGWFAVFRQTQWTKSWAKRFRPVSLKHNGIDRTDGPNLHCANDEVIEYFEDKSILTFLQWQSITICRGISSLNKVHIICSWFDVDTFRQILIILCFGLLHNYRSSRRCMDILKPVMQIHIPSACPIHGCIYIFFWIPYWPRMLINILWPPLDANQYGGP